MNINLKMTEHQSHSMRTVYLLHSRFIAYDGFSDHSHATKGALLKNTSISSNKKSFVFKETGLNSNYLNTAEKYSTAPLHYFLRFPFSFFPFVTEKDGKLVLTL